MNGRIPAPAMGPLISSAPPAQAPAQNRLWIDTGVSPTQMRRWRGMDVTTDRTYHATLAGDADSPAIISVPNAQGPTKADVTISCVTQQAGSGDPSPSNIRKISGRETVGIAATGKNLLPPISQPLVNNGVTYTPRGDGSYRVKGTSTGYGSYELAVHLPLRGTFTISGGKNGVAVNFAIYKNGNWVYHAAYSSSGNPGTATIGTLADGEYIRVYLQVAPGVTVDTIIYPQLEIGENATPFEPGVSMGGGTITPASPLYGLPGAEDTVMVNTAGNVTVTRRTGCIVLDGTESWIMGIKNSDGYYWRLPVSGILEITSPVIPNIICSNYVTVNPNLQWGNPINSISQNYNPGLRTEIAIYDTRYAQSEISEWKSYLAAQKSAGTPVTVVYELAAPTTETPAAITPITPDSGAMNICTDGDKISATLNLSGWNTIG